MPLDFYSRSVVPSASILRPLYVCTLLYTLLDIQGIMNIEFNEVQSLQMFCTHHRSSAIIINRDIHATIVQKPSIRPLRYTDTVDIMAIEFK